MNNNAFLLLVSKKLSGEATDEELKTLDAAISANSGFQKQYTILQKYWAEQHSTNQEFVDDALNKVLLQLDLPVKAPLPSLDAYHQQPAIRRLIPRMAAAACLIAFVIAGLLLLNLKYGKKAAPAEMSNLEKKQNSKGTKSVIELSDGSKVWLNADSKIQYPALFAGDTREIFLNGEAFFEVAKNPQKPFIIHLAKGTVRVLGTSFNIRAYDNEKVVETSVATGKVAFIPRYSSQKMADTVFITPNKKVKYHFYEESISIAPTLVTDDKAWTEGKLIFKAMTLFDITTELERNFGKKAVFLDDAAKDYIFTGSFQNNTLEEIMYYLSLSKSKTIYYRITSNELIVTTDATKL